MKRIPGFLISFFLLASCTKTNSDTPSSDVRVYVVGTAYDRNMNVLNSLYWEDSLPHILPSENGSAEASGIFYTNNRLYFEGFRNVVENIVPIYWDNNALVIPGSSDRSVLGRANRLFVSGNDVYLAGEGPNLLGEYVGDRSFAKFWKNGQATMLTSDSVNSQASAIMVSGTDVYISWYSYDPSSPFPTHSWYYKNGVNVSLDSNFTSVFPMAFCASGPDVYLLGGVYDLANNRSFFAYWKNGKMMDMQLGNEHMNIHSIAVSGDDIYVAGDINTTGHGQAAYWKNGEKHILTDGSLMEVVSGIAVLGTDVYVSGTEGGIPTYWKNGTAHRLAHTQGNMEYRTWGIVVVKN